MVTAVIAFDFYINFMTLHCLLPFFYQSDEVHVEFAVPGFNAQLVAVEPVPSFPLSPRVYSSVTIVICHS